jgi:hypothetical protein
VSVRYYLKSAYQNRGDDVGGQHAIAAALPDLENAWTFVRHPVGWLVSFYAYLSQNRWQWVELPQEIHDIFGFAYTMFWPNFVHAVTTIEPGAVGQVYDLYCVPGVTVYQLEEIDDVFGQPVDHKHKSEDKPLLTLENWQMICTAERDTLDRYGYNDVAPFDVKPAQKRKKRVRR